MSQHAFPTPEFYDEVLIGTSKGLTKRELFAALAMQGLLASLDGDDESAIAQIAVKQADALIAALAGQEAEG